MMKFFKKAFTAVMYKHSSTNAQSLSDEERNSGFCYELPFCHQQHLNMCADACENMLKSFWGINDPSIDMNKNPRGMFIGRNLDKRYFGNLAIETPEQIIEFLTKKGPLVISIPIAFKHHSVCLIGHTNQYFILHDPIEGAYRCIKKSKLMEICKKNGKTSIEIELRKPPLDMDKTLYEESIKEKQHTFDSLIKNTIKLMR